MSHANLLNLLLFDITGFILGSKLLLKRKYDFINTHFAIPGGPVGCLLKRFCACKNILTLHGADIYDPTRRMSGHRWWATRYLISKIIERADYTVASTKEIQGKVREFYKVSGDIKVIPLGFLPSRFLMRIEKKFSVHGPLKMVTVGRLVKRKNVTLLLEAVKQLGDKATLTIVGNGPEKEQLRKYARRLGLRNRVKFAGFLDERRKITELKKADIFVSASLHEGFGIVFLEAMQAGLPIIASDSGGQIYFLQDGIHAQFFRSGNKNDLVARIDHFCSHREDLALYGLRNREYVKRFYITRIAGRYINLIVERSEKSEDKFSLSSD